jgi:hypothetical protein
MAEEGGLGEESSLDERKRRIEELLGKIDAPVKKARKTRFSYDVPISKAFNPRSREQLLARLSTFHLYKYHSVSSPISAISLARIGWQLDSREAGECTLICVACKVQMTLLLESAKMSDTLVRRYAELAVSTHHEHCPCRRSACPLRILRIAFDSPKQALEQYRERISEKSIDIDLSGIQDCDMEHLTSLDNRPDMVALFGWRLVEHERLTFAECEACLRKVRIINNQPFQCAVEHFDYCPWIYGASQNGEPAWLLLIQYLIRDEQQASADLNHPTNSNMLADRLAQLQRSLNLKRIPEI